MAKPEWGTKRICQSCGARFYDMQRDPIVCPACGATMDLTVQAKPKRSRAAAKTATVAPEEVEVEETPVEEVAEEEEDEEEGAATADDEATDSEEEDSNSAIEDVSELGDDDMTDVIDTEIEDDEGER